MRDENIQHVSYLYIFHVDQNSDWDGELKINNSWNIRELNEKASLHTKIEFRFVEEISTSFAVLVIILSLKCMEILGEKIISKNVKQTIM